MENRNAKKILAIIVKKAFCWLCAAALLGHFVGCRKSAPSAPAENAEPQAMRIVSLAPNLTEILYALDAGQYLVGATEHCNWPAAAKRLPRVGSFWQPNAEAIVALRPTLAVGLNLPVQQPLAALLSPTGCQVVLLDDFERFGQLFDGIGALGAAVGRQEQAARLVEALKADIEKIRQTYSGRPARRVLWVIQRQPLRVAGTKTFISEMLATVGAVNAIGDTLHVYPPIGAEEMLSAAPDVIIEPANMPEDRVKQRQSAVGFYAGFSGVPAVAQGRIYVVDGDLTCRLGPRLAEALAEIAACVWEK